MLGLLVCLTVVVTSALAYLGTNSGRETVRQLLLKQAKTLIPGLTLRAIKGNFTDHLAIEGLSIADRFGDPVFTLDRLVVRYGLSIRRLLHRELVVYAVDLERPQLTVGNSKNGKLNLTQVVISPEQTKQQEGSTAGEIGWKLLLGALRLDDGSVRVSLSDAAGATDLVVDSLALNLSAFASDGQAHLTVDQLSLAATVPNRPRMQVYLRGGLTTVAGQLRGLVKLQSTGISSKASVAVDLDVGGSWKAPTLEVRITEGMTELFKLKVAAAWPFDKGDYSLALNVRKFAPNHFLRELPPASLAMDLNLKGHGVPTQVGSRTNLRLLILPSTVDAYDLEHGEVVASMVGENWQLEQMALSSPYGTLKAKGKGSLEDVALAVQAHLSGLDKIPSKHIGAPLAGVLDLKTEVSGRFADAIAVKGTLAGMKLGYSDLSLDSIAIPFDVTGLPKAPKGNLRFSLKDFRAAKAKLHINDATATMVGDPRRVELKIEGRGHELNLGVEAAVQAKGKAKQSIEVALTKLQAKFRGASLRLLQPAAVTFGRKKQALAIEPLRMAVLGGQMTVGGHFQLASTPRGRADVRVENLSLAKVRGLLKLPQRLRGRADVVGHFEGSATNPKLDLRLSLRQATVAQLEALDSTLRISGGDQKTTVGMNVRWQQKPIVDLQASTPRALGKLIRLSQRHLGLRQLPVTALVRLEATSLESLWGALPTLPPVKGTVEAEVALAGSLQHPRLNVTGTWQEAMFEQRPLGKLSLSLAAKGERRIESELNLRHNDNALLSVKGALGTTVARLLSNASALAKATLQAEVTLGPYPLKELAALDAKFKELRGAVLGTIRVFGKAGDPQASWDIGIENLSRGDLKVDQFRVAGTYASQRLQSNLSLKQGQAGTIDGRLDYRHRDKTLTAEVQGKSLDLGLVALAPMVDQSGGTLDLDLTVTGPVAKPEVRGRVDLANAHFQLFGQSPLRDLNLSLALTPKKIDLVSLALKAGEGGLKGTGSLEIIDQHLGPFTADFEATRLGGFPGALAQASFDGKLQLSGAFSDNHLKGKVRLTEGVLRVPKLEGQDDLHSTAAMTDLVFADAQARQKAALEQEKSESGGKGAKKKAKPMGLDISFETASFFLRGEQLRTELNAQLLATRDDKGDLSLKGRVHSERGEVNVLGSEFKLQRANILFSGQPANPGLAIELNRNIGGITVMLGVRGTAAAPELILSSDPAGYDRSQLLSLILTGRLALDQGSSDAEGQAVAVANAVGQALVGDYARQLAGKVGLDVAKINVGQHQDGAGANKLHLEAEVGKYLTRRLYMGYRQVIGADEGQNSYIGLLEYSLSARWLLSALLGDAGVGALDLLWTYQY